LMVQDFLQRWTCYLNRPN